MARYAIPALVIAGLISGCTTVREIPVPVPCERECPTLGEQIAPEVYAPVRSLGRRELLARGELNRHLWLVFLEQEQELMYCNQRFDMLRKEVEGGSDEDRD